MGVGFSDGKSFADMGEMLANSMSGDFQSRFGAAMNAPKGDLTEDSLLSSTMPKTSILGTVADSARSILSSMPLGGSTEPAGALKSPEGTQTPEKVRNDKIIATIPVAKQLGLQGADITEGDVDKAVNIGLSAGPGMIVSGKAALVGDDFWRQSFKAAALENKGASAQEIQQATGLFRRTPNGRWVHEMSDEGMKLTDRDWKYGESGKLPDFVDHPELFKAYPAMKDVNFKVADKDFEWLGGYSAGTNTLTINPRKIPAGDEGLLDVIAHEMQHWVQRKEGFPQGSNPDQALKDAVWSLGSKAQQEKDPAARGEMMQLMSDIAKNAKSFAEYMYQRIPGEVEANTTMARRKLTTQQRNDFPIDEFKKFMEGSENTLSGGKYYPEFNYPKPGATAAESAMSPIRSAAIKHGDKTYEGVNHFEAMQAAEKAGADISKGKLESGFITHEGKFVDRDEAAKLVNMEGPLISEYVPHLGYKAEAPIWWRNLRPDK